MKPSAVIAAANASSKAKRERTKHTSKPTAKKKDGMPKWAIALICVLGLVVPIVGALIMIYKRGKQTDQAAPSQVSTNEPVGEYDDEPDSPRPDPFASAFGAQGEDEEEERKI